MNPNERVWATSVGRRGNDFALEGPGQSVTRVQFMGWSVPSHQLSGPPNPTLRFRHTTQRC
jgi:hypothetical protein